VACAVALVDVGAAVLVGGGGSPPAGRPIAVAVAPPGRLSGRVVPHGDGKPSPVPAALDGCDHNYADGVTGRRICVPVAPPPGQRIDCAYLRAHGIQSVRVIGDDTRGLGGGLTGALRGAVLCAL
jgi:hypothetical protein